MSGLDPMALDCCGAAHRLAAGEVAELAQQHSYPLEMIEALLDVEAAGSGFDVCGRPKMLSEPHVLFRTLGAGPARDRLVAQGVCYERWGAQPYPVTSDLNYARLAVWCSVDEEAAMTSCSWGIGQVMGFNHKACGYDSAIAMVSACMESELAQFVCVLAYLEHAGLSAAIRAKDCLTIAHGYNGSGQAATYALRLRRALLRHGGPPVAPPLALAPALRQAPTSVSSLNDAEWLRVRAGASGA